MAPKVAVALALATSPVSLAAVLRGQSGNGMQPEVVARTLANVQDEWKAQADVFAECSSTAGLPGASIVNCADAPSSFGKSCDTVVNAIVQGSGGDKDVAKEYMADVCSQRSMSGWHQNQCSALAIAVQGSMSVDKYSNRASFDTNKLCTGFWSKLLDGEKTRMDKEKAEHEAAEKKAAEEAAAQEKKFEEERKNEAERQAKRAKEEAEARVKEEAREEAERAKKEAEAKEAEAKARLTQKKAEAKAVQEAATKKMEEANQAEQEQAVAKKAAEAKAKAAEVKPAATPPKPKAAPAAATKPAAAAVNLKAKSVAAPAKKDAAPAKTTEKKPVKAEPAKKH